MDIKTEKFKPTHLHIRIPDNMHAMLKEIAQMRGCSVTKYVMRLLIEALVKEGKYK